MEDHHYPNFGYPRIGAKQAMEYFRRLGLKIMVFTARTHISGLDGKFQNVNKIVQDIHNWADEYSIPVDYVWPYLKPASIICFFDDRGVRVAPPGENGGVDFGWFDAINTFDRAYKSKLPEWLREVTPKSFAVADK